jgi:ABC-type nitrate/sulfonate/bicarbonate transport system permease component
MIVDDDGPTARRVLWGFAIVAALGLIAAALSSLFGLI